MTKRATCGLMHRNIILQKEDRLAAPLHLGSTKTPMPGESRGVERLVSLIEHCAIDHSFAFKRQ
jgi:hypothetical protein